MTSIPVMLQLTKRNIVVIGGGKVAERRISALINTGALIKVVSPHVTSTLESYAQEQRINWIKKTFTPTDVIDAFLIIIATNNSKVNSEVLDAAPKHALINAVESAKEGNVQFPTYLSRGKLSIAVSTDGASPYLAKKIKTELTDAYDEQFEDYLEFLDEARKLVKKSNLQSEEKKAILKQLVTEDWFDPLKQAQWLNAFRLQIEK